MSNGGPYNDRGPGVIRVNGKLITVAYLNGILDVWAPSGVRSINVVTASIANYTDMLMHAVSELGVVVEEEAVTDMLLQAIITDGSIPLGAEAFTEIVKDVLADLSIPVATDSFALLTLSAEEVSDLQVVIGQTDAYMTFAASSDPEVEVAPEAQESMTLAAVSQELIAGMDGEAKAYLAMLSASSGDILMGQDISANRVLVATPDEAAILTAVPQVAASLIFSKAFSASAPVSMVGKEEMTFSPSFVGGVELSSDVRAYLLAAITSSGSIEAQTQVAANLLKRANASFAVPLAAVLTSTILKSALAEGLVITAEVPGVIAEVYTGILMSLGVPIEAEALVYTLLNPKAELGVEVSMSSVLGILRDITCEQEITSAAGFLASGLQVAVAEDANINTEVPGIISEIFSSFRVDASIEVQAAFLADLLTDAMATPGIEVGFDVVLGLLKGATSGLEITVAREFLADVLKEVSNTSDIPLSHEALGDIIVNVLSGDLDVGTAYEVTAAAILGGSAEHGVPADVIAKTSFVLHTSAQEDIVVGGDFGEGLYKTVYSDAVLYSTQAGKIKFVSLDGVVSGTIDVGPDSVFVVKAATGSDGSVYVGGYDPSNLRKYDGRGNLDWASPLVSSVGTQQVYHVELSSDDHAYVATYHSIRHVNPDGSLGWEFIEDSGPLGNKYAYMSHGLALDPSGDYLYPMVTRNVNVPIHRLYKLDASTGASEGYYSHDNTTLPGFTYTNDFTGVAPGPGGYVFVTSRNDRLIKIDPSDMSVVWDETFSPGVVTWGSGNLEYDGVGALYLSLYTRHSSGGTWVYTSMVRKMDPSDGSIIWTSTIGAGTSSILVNELTAEGDEVYAGLNGGSLVKLDPDTGDILWTLPVWDISDDPTSRTPVSLGTMPTLCPILTDPTDPMEVLVGGDFGPPSRISHSKFDITTPASVDFSARRVLNASGAALNVVTGYESEGEHVPPAQELIQSHKVAGGVIKTGLTGTGLMGMTFYVDGVPVTSTSATSLESTGYTNDDTHEVVIKQEDVDEVGRVINGISFRNNTSQSTVTGFSKFSLDLSANLTGTSFGNLCRDNSLITEIAPIENNGYITRIGYAFYNCSGLTEIPTGLFDDTPDVTSFERTFFGCSGLTSIPSGLFDNTTKVTHFNSTFQNCSNITSIPSGLFDNTPLVTSFGNTFQNCSVLTSIPSGLFDNTPDVPGFQSTFSGCSGLTSIPSGLFDNTPLVNNFSSTFLGCSGITSIPSGLFDYNTKVTTFNNTFNGCSGITSIPIGLFDYTPLATVFYGTFRVCSSITSIPGDLFDNTPNVTTFTQTFYGCEAVTSNVPTLWISHSSADHNQTFQWCTNAANYGSIPPGWR